MIKLGVMLSVLKYSSKVYASFINKAVSFSLKKVLGLNAIFCSISLQFLNTTGLGPS